MSDQRDRRQVLKISMGAIAVAGAGLTGALPASAAGHPKLEPVPGMHGDRRANEVWYQFDDQTLFHRIKEVSDAFAEIHEILGENSVQQIWQNWLAMSNTTGYPGNYTAFVAPISKPLQVLSRVQLGIFDTYYQPFDPRLVSVFADFGQGTLFDPRRAEFESEVHTMDGVPPVGYHIWHAILRAMMFLDIDRSRWAAMDPLIAFAWAVQAVAKPKPREVNPPLPRATVRDLAISWLPRKPERLDRDFRSLWYPEGLG